jgi:hypothetical protein
MAASYTARPDSIRPRPRQLHGLFAVLISFALVLSLFHCCCIDGDDGALTASVAQASCDLSGKTSPAAPAPHCCHCLAHVTAVAPQDSAVAIEYVAGAFSLAAAPLPYAADLASPFKPPRA